MVCSDIGTHLRTPPQEQPEVHSLPSNAELGMAQPVQPCSKKTKWAALASASVFASLSVAESDQVMLTFSMEDDGDSDEEGEVESFSSVCRSARFVLGDSEGETLRVQACPSLGVGNLFRRDPAGR